MLKIYIVIIAVILFLIPVTVLADEQSKGGTDIFEGWDDNDKSLFVASEILLVADWGQSLDINRKGLSDNNPILNHAPISTVNTYFAAWLVANYFITDNLPGDYRKLWLVGLVVGEMFFVGSNYGAGINIAF